MEIEIGGVKLDVDAKVRFFLEYMMNEHKDSDYITIMELMTEEQFIKSAAEYIEKKKIKAKITANNYFSNVFMFFKENNVKNKIFINLGNLELLRKKYKEEIVNTIKDEDVKDNILTDEELYSLEIKIDEYISEDEGEKILKNIAEKGISKQIGFNDFMSGIALKIAINYGVKNGSLTNIKISDYKENDNEIEINKNRIKLSNSFNNQIKMYIKIRNKILDESNRTSIDFFIKQKGKAITNKNGNSDNSAILCLLKRLEDVHSMDIINKRVIINMIKTGVDFKTIIDITGYKESVIKECIDYYHLELDSDNYVNEVFTKLQKTKKVIPTNTLKCPVCNRIFSNNAENWMIVIYEGRKDKVIVCKKCKGEEK